MKNPQITASLNNMMQDEIAEKKSAITCIIDAYKQLNRQFNEFDLICELMELSLGDICQILGDLTSDLWSEICHKFGCKPEEF